MPSNPIDALRLRLAANPPEPGELWLVAVSGGADSVFLLRSLHQLRTEFGYDLAVAHFDHGLRGTESRDDGRFVAGIAAELELPCHAGAAPAGALGADGRWSEDAARTLRHAFLEETRRHAGAGRILLAHHADDQAETIFINFLRGSGPAGLAGMRERTRDGRLFRPLLGLAREAIRAELASRGWQFREDSSNEDTRRARNALRHEVLPALESRFNLNLRESLAGAAPAFRSWVDLVESQADEALAAARRDSPGAILSLEWPVFSKYTEAVRKFALGKALNESAGIRGLTRTHLNSLERLGASKEGGKRVCLPDSFEAARERDRLVVYKAMEFPSFSTQALGVPGEVVLAGGDRILARRVPPSGEPGPTPERIWVDPASVQGELAVRRRLPGDRFEPWGLGAETKLKDFLIAARVPRRLRGQLWLLADARNVLWVLGHRPSERLRLTRLPEEVIEVRLEPAALPRN